MRWYILTGPDQFQNTARLKALYELLLDLGVNAKWTSNATIGRIVRKVHSRSRLTRLSPYLSWVAQVGAP